MSKIDSEVLYFILTKVAAGGPFYNYDPAKLASTQTPGTITHRQLGEVYERITGVRVSIRTNWNQPLDQLNLLLGQCGLPSLSHLILTSAEASEPAPASKSSELKRIQNTQWPLFSALKTLYRK